LSYAKWSLTMAITRCSTDTARPSERWWKPPRVSAARVGSNQTRGTVEYLSLAQH
jgi:hypothetical protein